MTGVEILRLDLIRWLSSEDDNAVLEEVNRIRQQAGTVHLADAEKKAIDKALADIEAGKVKPHAEVMAETLEKYSHLFRKKDIDEA